MAPDYDSIVLCQVPLGSFHCLPQGERNKDIAVCLSISLILSISIRLLTVIFKGKIFPFLMLRDLSPYETT